VLPWEVIHPRFEEVRTPVPLAVVTAEKDENEAAVRERIREALEKGAREVWVVQREGEPRVEVHDGSGLLRTKRPGEEIDMPGVLLHPVPVTAFCTDVREEIMLRKALRGTSKRGGPEA